jgi:hypothetical protein
MNTSTQSERQAVILDHLSQEGFRPTVEEDGDIGFKYQGEQLWIQVGEFDSMYYRIMGYSLKITSADEVKYAYIAASRTSQHFKVVKAYLTLNEQHVSVCIEAFSASATDFISILEKSINLVVAGRAKLNQDFTNLISNL